MEFGKKAAVLEAQGYRVIKLSLGEPDFGAPSPVADAMRAIMDGRPLPCTPALGIAELRAAIAGFYLEQHDVVVVVVDPARVIVTAGASAALLLVLAAVVDPGDTVIMGDPSYPCNRQLVATCRASRNSPLEINGTSRKQEHSQGRACLRT